MLDGIGLGKSDEDDGYGLGKEGYGLGKEGWDGYGFGTDANLANAT